MHVLIQDHRDHYERLSVWLMEKLATLVARAGRSQMLMNHVIV